MCHSASPAARVAGEARYVLRGLSAAGARGEGGEGAEGPPARFKIANWGLDTFRESEAVLVNEAAVAEIRRRMAAHRQDRVRIDIAHTTAFKKAAEMQPENILGYGDLEDVPGDGLYVCNATWTDRGRQIWRALPDPSPAFLCRKGDHMMTQLDSVGLCPDGELELPTLCAADEPSTQPPADSRRGIYLQTITESAMIEILTQLLKKAGVSVPDKGAMTDAEYESALTAAAADYLGKGEPAEPEEKPMELKALEKRLAAAEKMITGYAGAADKAAKDEILRKCSAEGKVMPLTDAQIYGTGGETAVALSAMQAIYANLTPTVPVQTGGAARKGDNPKPAEVPVALSADQRRINEMMGVTQEEVQKYTKTAAD
jgi:phage I-like protein